jgi:glyceraldehyde 3-phosphate dehydrogenase
MGNLENDITADGDTIKVDNDSFKGFSEKTRRRFDWESDGAKLSSNQPADYKSGRRRQHIRGSVKKVIISRPAKGEDVQSFLGVTKNV